MAFYVVYIREAHAADSKWPAPVPGDEEILTPKTLAERKAIANKCAVRLKLDIPCIVDDMDDTVAGAYDAHPDRLFVVDTDGRIALQGDPGPWGFGPAVEALEEWLAGRFPAVAGTASENHTWTGG